MERIYTKHLKEILHGNEEAIIINVLSKEEFKQEHIPGSINIPLEGSEDFVQRVERVVPSKNQKIVVYCESKECSASEMAAEKLDSAGFSYVMDFEGGLNDWKQEGEPVEQVA